LEPELHLREVFFNQESTYYYVLTVSEMEFSKFRPHAGEVATLKRLTVAELEKLGSDDIRTTDTLLCLKAHNAFRKLDQIQKSWH